MAYSDFCAAIRSRFIWRPPLPPLQGEPFILRVPRVETLGFYEADFVKTRRENCFLFIFVSFLDDL
jgi:hypothetical protein